MKESPKAKAKIKKVMHEMKAGKLHSGSKKGPLVKNPKQGLAIALSEAGVSKKKKQDTMKVKKKVKTAAKQIMKHLKGDIHESKESMAEDKKMMKKVKGRCQVLAP